jgi:MEKHLA domain
MYSTQEIQMVTDSSLPWQQALIIQHSRFLCQSFQKWTDKALVELPDVSISPRSVESDFAIAQALFDAPFAVLSHGSEADPVLNYGNQTALTLWQMSWAEFTQMPSRLTAEPISRQERDRLLAEAASQGFISGYRGVRIASTGARFWIENAMIWDVLDDVGNKRGQAAKFDTWTPLS